MSDTILDTADLEISDDQKKLIKEMPLESKVAIVKLLSCLDNEVDSYLIKLLF